MMIVVESMSNGALDSFLRVSVFWRGHFFSHSLCEKVFGLKTLQLSVRCSHAVAGIILI